MFESLVYFSGSQSVALDQLYYQELHRNAHFFVPTLLPHVLGYTV